MDHFGISRNGSIRNWVADGKNNLLFPDQYLTINGETKRRGDSHVGAPIMGRMPKTEAYADADLPQHGFARIADQMEGVHFRTSIYETREGLYSSTKLDFASIDKFPFEHGVTVCVESTKGGFELEHDLMIQRAQDCNNPKLMPVSMGFHPYFATFGEPFKISCSEYKVSSEGIKEGSSFHIPRVGDRVLRLEMGHGTILMSLAGGEYTSFCVWTDAVSKYICVEPVLGKPDDAYKLLKPGEELIGKCTMRFVPS